MKRESTVSPKLLHWRKKIKTPDPNWLPRRHLVSIERSWPPVLHKFPSSAGFTSSYAAPSIQASNKQVFVCTAGCWKPCVRALDGSLDGICERGKGMSNVSVGIEEEKRKRGCHNSLTSHLFLLKICTSLLQGIFYLSEDPRLTQQCCVNTPACIHNDDSFLSVTADWKECRKRSSNVTGVNCSSWWHSYLAGGEGGIMPQQIYRNCPELLPGTTASFRHSDTKTDWSKASLDGMLLVIFALYLPLCFSSSELGSSQKNRRLPETWHVCSFFSLRQAVVCQRKKKSFVEKLHLLI